MPLAAETWSFIHRLRRKFGRPDIGTWGDAQKEWIRAHAPGRSFADIGGLYMKEGEYAFVAEEAGATAVTEFDVGDPDLSMYATHHKERGSNVRFVQGDLEDPESVREIGPHDVVWCTGVLYHTPNPVRQLMNLRELTRELLYLGTFTIPDIPGFPNACVYYPYLNDGERAPYAKGYRWAADGGRTALGIGSPIDETPMRGLANCWWGISKSALWSMLRTARFEVVEERRVHPSPYITELVARPIEGDPLMPPPTYFRERGVARERDGTRLPFEDWYERQRGNAAPTGG